MSRKRRRGEESTPKNVFQKNVRCCIQWRQQFCLQRAGGCMREFYKAWGGRRWELRRGGRGRRGVGSNSAHFSRIGQHLPRGVIVEPSVTFPQLCRSAKKNGNKIPFKKMKSTRDKIAHVQLLNVTPTNGGAAKCWQNRVAFNDPAQEVGKQRRRRNSVQLSSIYPSMMWTVSWRG